MIIVRKNIHPETILGTGYSITRQSYVPREHLCHQNICFDDFIVAPDTSVYGTRRSKPTYTRLRHLIPLGFYEAVAMYHNKSFLLALEQRFKDIPLSHIEFPATSLLYKRDAKDPGVETCVYLHKDRAGWHLSDLPLSYIRTKHCLVALTS